MIAVDANVLVRFLTDDDPGQAQRARAALESSAVFIATTVILETEWVLRSAYGLDRGRVAEALTRLAGLPRVILEEPEKVAEALRGMKRGLDFADALHLAAAHACEAFLTFDRRLAGVAAGSPSPPIREP